MLSNIVVEYYAAFRLSNKSVNAAESGDVKFVGSLVCSMPCRKADMLKKRRMSAVSILSTGEPDDIFLLPHLRVHGLSLWYLLLIQ
jgi:hypothetical protein